MTLWWDDMMTMLIFPTRCFLHDAMGGFECAKGILFRILPRAIEEATDREEKMLR